MNASPEILDLVCPDVPSWRLRASDPLWLRNQVVAPLTEEVVFRGAMLPMLVPCTGPSAAIFIAPLFFGVGMATRCGGDPRKADFSTNLFWVFSQNVIPAHLHHVFEQQSLSEGRRGGVFLVSGQSQYTAFINLRVERTTSTCVCVMAGAPEPPSLEPVPVGQSPALMLVSL